MPYSLTWLPDVLLHAGLKVSEVPGWRNRGRGDVSRIFGVICHHTAGPKNGNMPSLNILVNGRAGLPGPLAQLGLGRDGTYYIIAAGRANHAGKGRWKGITNGNSNFIGIEAENTGLPTDSWSEVQLDAYCRGVAAILKHIKQGVEFCAGHREYATPAGRKPDPRFEPHFDMDRFRSTVATIIDGTAVTPILIPAMESSTGRPTLRRGMTGKMTKWVQAKIGVTADGIFGAKTEATVRNFQRKNDLVPDGIVGPKTWQVLDTITD